MTNTKRNTSTHPTMAVVSRKVMTNLLMKVAETGVMYLDEERGAMAVKY